ncbi:MAG: Transposase [Tenericutes bacterium ADurb.BinA155]|nr:MAG: Transposase [Tenericutes bacterium ADurb.BinA155]
MDSNAFLARFGFDPEDFEAGASGPIRSDDGFVYEATELRKEDAECPFCRSAARVEVNKHYTATVRCCQSAGPADSLLVRRIVYRCRGCGRTFTLDLKGIAARRGISSMERNEMVADFSSHATFSEIGLRHHCSPMRCIQLFDEAFPLVRRLPLPRVLCIDEIHFSSQFDQKYCCVLLDFETGRVVDVVRSRQKAYLEEYFDAIPYGERARVKWLVSDMYDEYASVCRLFLPAATLAVDRFHVVVQLTNAINAIRTRVMRGWEKGTPEYNFMKSHWREFLRRGAEISPKWYANQRTGESVPYAEMVRRCTLLSRDLRECWDALQDLMKYTKVQSSYTEAVGEVTFISEKLMACQAEEARKAGQTYKRWKNGIAMGLSRNDLGLKLSNGKMECLNNRIKTIIKDAYGYRNFERFRKRALLILWGDVGR